MTERTFLGFTREEWSTFPWFPVGLGFGLLIAGLFWLVVLLSGCGAARQAEQFWADYEVSEKIVDLNNLIWDKRYGRLGQSEGTGFILVTKYGYGCAVTVRAFTMAEEGRLFSCRWRRQRGEVR